SHESFDVPITGDPGTNNAKDSQTSFGEEDHGVSKEDEAVETAIQLILGHKWIGRGLKFMVEWVDDDVTWESLSNIKDCVALDDYLVHHGLAEPSKLSKKICQDEVHPKMDVFPRMTWIPVNACFGPIRKTVPLK
ncbi:hypothetical protein F5877DRAFT_73655, partial [Lentinula edodes]